MAKKTAKSNQRGVQDSDKLIGERIRQRRNQIGMSQEELGEALGVSFQQVQKYEKAANRISSGRLLDIARALECSINALLGSVGDKGAKITPESRFAASREGVAIINAMARISSIDLRRRVIRLAECLGTA